MRTVKFGESEIEVIDFEDATAGERVIEFRYRGDPTEASFAAIVVPDGGSWLSALLSIDPQAGDVSAPLMADLMEVARSLIEAR
ncbi:hypothetical protein AB0E70_08795 [Streptomyces murinus]|uniref:hypothetical protein n=1 Tax=Streptomyces murinus TaxID=33900 RepID=UPI000A37E738|nr:hypothetical protein [Streptomyces murinus]